MFKRLRKRLTYANVAMTLALVFAMSGGAYAAGKYLITSTKQIKPSVLASLKGKAGPAGKEGPAGAAGKEGPAGKEGAAGKEGKAGANGVNGVNGEGVTSAALKAGEEGCAEGGSKFTVAGKTTTACGGERGPKGPEGSPWTDKGVLPSEATETGSVVVQSSSAETEVFVPISFTIPLKTAPTEGYFVSKEEQKKENSKKDPAGCTVGTVEGSAANPIAAPGNLCVYESTASPTFPGEFTLSLFFSPNEENVYAPGKTGAVMLIRAKAAGEFMLGSWAVTAE
jgi:hypothetical protein